MLTTPSPPLPEPARDDGAAPRTLAEKAYLALRRDIVLGHHQGGDRLRVEHLKDRYGVGAGTLREALALLVSDALVVAEGQRGFRVSAMSLADLEDVTATRLLIETEALRQSVRRGDAQWEARLRAAYEALAAAEARRRGVGLSTLDPAWESGWEAANKHFHEVLISAHDSDWSRHLLGILFRHAERYRHVVLRMGAAEDVQRDVHREHTEIYAAAMARQDARAALALEAHVRLTCDILRQRARAAS
jgi:GntR family transcriptional regulator, carbon starvation induced regulator